MLSSVTAKDKKDFIQWFLNHYRLKKRESVWILNYLVNHMDILEHVHFVRDVKYCPRGVMISSRCSEKIPFRFYKKHLVTTDAEKTFHDIRLNKQEALFIQLNFHQANQSAYYAAVLEENPFLPDDYYLTKDDKQTTSELLDQLLINQKQERLREAIDEALDSGNHTKFLELTKELEKLLNKS
ncbi:ReoY family proteolytic degradation factor [Oceanobacillus oncorhynchi subsp. oncorhynchi]|uniref:ReoY family proteolytic degradation factor n=1 Tax=Oceanobacillus oncorhynchi TaxID=545501 RepID=UPI0031D8FD8E